jgi:hypothetical protein
MVFHDEKSMRGVNLAWACSAKHDAGISKTTLYMSAGQANSPRYFGADEGGAELWDLIRDVEGVLLVGNRALFTNQVVDWRMEDHKLKVFTVNSTEIFSSKQEIDQVLSGLGVA